ncbi:hypothetical protein Tco_0294406 [Tanacetum coccineum]
MEDPEQAFVEYASSRTNEAGGSFNPLNRAFMTRIGTDIAKISRKRSKPDNHGHGNGKENTRARRMLSKVNKNSSNHPPSPDFVPESVYLEFMPPEDEVLSTEEQPLPAAVSPTADSPSYVPESDPEEDPEEEDDEDPKEDPADYPANGVDDGNDEDESSDDDEDDDVDIKWDAEEEDHLAPADSTAVALPAVHAPSAEETKPFKTDESAATPPPHLAYRVTARISIRDEPPTPFWSDIELARLLAIPTPPPSPLSPWSSPLPQIPSPPLPVSPPPPASPTYLLGYRAAMIRLRVEAPSTSYSPLPHIILSHTRAYTPPSGTPPILPIPLPTSSPSLLLPAADHKADMPEVWLPPQKRLCFAFGPRYQVGESSSAAATRPTGGFRVDYGFVATIDREIRRDLERDVGYEIINTWDEMLVDMPGAPTTDDTELGRQMTEFTTKVVITELQAVDRKRQAAITELLAADHKRQAQFIEKMAPKRATKSNTAPETTNTTSVTNAQLQAMIDQGVTAALAARDADRNTNGDDSHNSGTGVRRTERTACEFENQVKFATCTLHSVALTWWNTHVKTVGHDAAYGMPWKTLMKMMTDKYCPRNEIKKLEMKIWDLKVKESDKIEIYVGGLPDMIHGSVVASKPKTMQEVVEIATELMDKKICTFADRQTENKRKQDNNQQQQPPQNKRQNTGRAYSAGHFKRECPKLKNNNNRGNSAGNVNAPAKVYAVDHAGKNPDSNVMMVPSNHCVCREDRSYPLGNETLIVHGDGSNRGNEARLHIISYTKIQEYMLKGCPVFLANVTTKETEDKSKKKRPEDVPLAQDFPDVFPEDLPSLPLTRQVEF